MRLRTVGFAAFAAAAIMQSCQPACTPAPPVPAPVTVPVIPPAPPPVTTIVVEGQGNGHGRGLSAWGAYGMAVNAGVPWWQILDHYYGGTTNAPAPNAPVRIRLMALDDAGVVGIVSLGRTATWNGATYGSLHFYEVAPNRYDVYGTSDVSCPGGGTGWVMVAQAVPGPFTVSTPHDESVAPAGDVLGLCQPNGSVVHYRGTLTITEDASGANRVVDTLLTENYVRGVVSREVASSWGAAGGGAGMNALYAMAVAARSFAFAQGRYPYADTCDTSSCQVYGGAAYRSSAQAPTSHPTVRVCEVGNLTFECATTDRAVGDTAGVVRVWQSNGAIISGEYSASHGPRSAGGTYPPVEDTASNVPQNTLYRWTRNVDAATVAATYGLGTLTGARTERDPSTIYDGVWGHRVVLTGTAGSATVSAWDFRNAFGLPSPGFTILGVV